MSLGLKRQFWEGLLLIALGAGILALAPSQVKTIAGLGTELSPAFLPNLAGIGLLITGSLITIVSLFSTHRAKKIKFDSKEIKKVAISVFVLFLYAFLFPKIGFLTTSMIIIGILSFICGQRNYIKLLILVLVMPAMVWAMFELLFVIPLPHGLLF